jgi:hypothetical protein
MSRTAAENSATAKTPLMALTHFHRISKGEAMYFGAAQRFACVSLLTLFCLLSAAYVEADPIFGDRIEILRNPTPTSGSIFQSVLDFTQTPAVSIEGDISLPESSKERADFSVDVGTDNVAFAAAKTTILLSDNKGVSDALVVTRLSAFSLEFNFFSDSESALKLTDFTGSLVNIPETGNNEFPGIGAEALLNVTKVIFPNASILTVLPITVLIGSDRDPAVDAPPTLLLICLGLSVLFAARFRRVQRAHQP